MPRKSKADRARAENISRAREQHQQAAQKAHKVTIEEIEDEEATAQSGSGKYTSNDPVDSQLFDIIEQFVRIQDDTLSVCDSDDDDEEASDPTIEIQELSELEVFSQTLQQVHDAAAKAERDREKRNNRPKTYRGNSSRTKRRHELNRKELEKKGFPSVLKWLQGQQKEKTLSEDEDMGEFAQQVDYVSSDEGEVSVSESHCYPATDH